MSELTDIEEQRGHEYTKEDLFERLKEARREAEENLGKGLQVSSRYIAAVEKLDRYKKALEEISKGEGPYSRDELTHAANCIDSMKRIAISALAKPKEGEDGSKNETL